MISTANFKSCYFFPLRKPNKTGYMPFCGFTSAPLHPQRMLLFKKGKKFHYVAAFHPGTGKHQNKDSNSEEFFIYDFDLNNDVEDQPRKNTLLCRIQKSDFKTYFLTEDEMRNRKIEDILE